MFLLSLNLWASERHKWNLCPLLSIILCHMQWSCVPLPTMYVWEFNRQEWRYLFPLCFSLLKMPNKSLHDLYHMWDSLLLRSKRIITKSMFTLCPSLRKMFICHKLSIMCSWILFIGNYMFTLSSISFPLSTFRTWNFGVCWRKFLGRIQSQLK